MNLKSQPEYKPREHDGSVYSIAPVQDKSREGLNLTKIVHAIKLPFSRKLSVPMLELERFTDLDIEFIATKIRGAILDVDGTLVEHHGQTFDPKVIATIEELRRVMPVCIFSNNSDSRPALLELGLPVVTNVKPKPHPQGFLVAADKYLGGLNPREVGMFGDNYLTDGGCRYLDMPFIHVKPIPGPERFFHRKSRDFGIWASKLHHRVVT